jgi:hypothetical protein
MTAAEIAARLTPAMVRALRGRSIPMFRMRVHPATEEKMKALGCFDVLGRPSPLGREVLAVLDKDAAQ